MIFSAKYSYLAIRIGLAVVFFWFGIDKFFHPLYWLNAWVPPWIVPLAAKFGVTAAQIIYINGVFEVLIGLSLVTGVFMRFFALVGIVFLVAIALTARVAEITIRDIGLVGSLFAIVLWPEHGDGKR